MSSPFLPSSLPPAAANPLLPIRPALLSVNATCLQEVVGRSPCYVRLASARRGIELEAERENDAIRER